MFVQIDPSYMEELRPNPSVSIPERTQSSTSPVPSVSDNNRCLSTTLNKKTFAKTSLFMIENLMKSKDQTEGQSTTQYKSSNVQ